MKANDFAEIELKRALTLLETPRTLRSWLNEQPDRTFESWSKCINTFLAEKGIAGQPKYYSSHPGLIRIHGIEANVPQWCWNVVRSGFFPSATLKDDKWELAPISTEVILSALNSINPKNSLWFSEEAQ
jgi:hypothetical protein